MPNIKTLAVCGDSWMAAVKPPHIGHSVHFTQLIAEHFGWEYRTLARGGVSNKVIRLQAETFMHIGLEDTLLLFNDTGSDRGEFLTLASNYNTNRHINNILYAEGPDLSSEDPFISTVRAPALASQTFNNMINERFEVDPTVTIPYITPMHMVTLARYISHMHDPRWEQQQDTWLMEGLADKLDVMGMEYYYISGFFDNSSYGVRPNTILKGDTLHPMLYSGMDTNCLERYHMHSKEQYRLAKHWIKRLTADGYE
jgi:hypothetical protein